MQNLGCAKSGMLLKGKSVAFLSPFLYLISGNMVKIVSYLGMIRMILGGRIEQQDRSFCSWVTLCSRATILALYT